jgi:peroxin-1
MTTINQRLGNDVKLLSGEESTNSEIISQLLQVIIINIISKNSKIGGSTTSFGDVGGLKPVKNLIIETFRTPIKYSFIYNSLPIKLPRGIMLYGPPGCGKTMIAAATANELKINFLSVKGPELLNKYIGASEQAVRDIFEKASAQSPCIIFLDEFDAIVPRRNSGSTGVTDRVVNQFLCYLDGVTEIKDVYILAASSRPDIIDPALLRPGRIDKHIYCDFPDLEERLEILQVYTRSAELQDIDLKEYAKKCEGFSGADLNALIKNSLIKVIHQLMEEMKGKSEQDRAQAKLVLTNDTLDITLQEINKTANPEQQRKQTQIYRDFMGKQPLDIKHQKQTLH